MWSQLKFMIRRSFFIITVFFIICTLLSILYPRNDRITPDTVKGTSEQFQDLMDVNPVTHSDPRSDQRSEEQYNQTLFFSRDTSHYINLLDTRPPNYLTNYKNPCWEEERPASPPYNQNPLYNDKKFVDSLKNMEKLWLSNENQDLEKQIRCLPYFYVAGFPKCGTSDIYNKIILHPDVAHPPRKEIHWWSGKRTMQKKTYNYAWVPISMYVDLFDTAAGEISEKIMKSPDNKEPYHPMIVGEGTPTTVRGFDNSFYMPENDGFTKPYFVNPHYIHHVTPEAKIIISVRNPTSRVYSAYLYFGTVGSTSPTLFHKQIVKSISAWESCVAIAPSHLDCLYNKTLQQLYPSSALRYGIYHYYIREWLEVFPREQFMIIRLEDYAPNRTSVLSDVFHFLGLRSLSEKEMSDIDNEMIKNKTGRKKTSSGPMLEETKELLDKFYAEHNKALADLLGDDIFAYT